MQAGRCQSSSINWFSEIFKFCCLSHGAFTVIFSVGLITRDALNWLLADLTAYTVRQQILILSATTDCTLSLSQSLLRFA
jgi:hypothetical protein